MTPRLRRSFAALLALAAAPAAAEVPQLLYAAEGNRLRRYDIDTLEGPGPILEEIVFENARDDPDRGRDINGMICALPGASERFVAGEDTGQPHPPAGWGVFTTDGHQLGKLATSAPAATPDPYGCAFDAAGRLFTTETGEQFFGMSNGQLVLWFPPFEGFPGPPGAYPDSDATRDNACKLAGDLGTATGVAIDAEGRVYVAAASGMEVVRFSPPFPTAADAAGGCGARDASGAPRADAVQRERFLGPRLLDGLLTYSGLAIARNGNLYVASVATGRIAEFDLEGRLVQAILEPDRIFPPYETGTPQGLAVDARGTLYYADLDLTATEGAIDAGPDGKIWRIGFDADGRPLAPQLVASGLSFPDGLGVLPGDLEQRAARGELRAPAVASAAAPTPLAEPGPEPEDGGGGELWLVALLLLLLAFGLRSRLTRRERI